MDNLRMNSKDNYWHTTFFNRRNFRTSNLLFQIPKRPSSSVKLLKHNGIIIWKRSEVEKHRLIQDPIKSFRGHLMTVISGNCSF